MIYHLTTARGNHTLAKYTHLYRKSLAAKIITVEYASFLEKRSWPRGVYVFSDMERMNVFQCQFAARIWDKLNETPGASVTLNHPTKHLRRFDLLKKLFLNKLNTFDVFRVSSLPDTLPYPVFLRFDNQHAGPLSPLIHNRADLDRSINELLVRGEQLEHLMVSQYVDTADDDGVYSKYGAFRVGDQIVPRHVLLSRKWDVKMATMIKKRSLVSAEMAFIKSNPHRDRLMSIFELAGLEYGRIDYTVHGDDRIEVWEINDNPQACSRPGMYLNGRYKIAQYAMAGIETGFDELMGQVEDGDAVEFSVSL